MSKKKPKLTPHKVQKKEQVKRNAKFRKAARAEARERLAEKMDALDLIASTRGRADLLGRAILMGLTPPELEITPDVMLMLANVFADELSQMDQEEMRFSVRVSRALRFVLRDDLQPELAIVMASHISAIVNPEVLAEPEIADLVAAFKTKFANVLNYD